MPSGGLSLECIWRIMWIKTEKNYDKMNVVVRSWGWTRERKREGCHSLALPRGRINRLSGHLTHSSVSFQPCSKSCGKHTHTYIVITHTSFALKLTIYYYNLNLPLWADDTSNDCCDTFLAPKDVFGLSFILAQEVLRIKGCHTEYRLNTFRTACVLA